MNRLLCCAPLLAVALACVPAPVFAQLPDESTVIRNTDWRGMLAIANEVRKTDTDLAKRKYFEAWTYASFWAVYDPTKVNSGSRRADGLQGMTQIRRDGAGLGLDDTFRELDKLQAENPPQVFSGGPKNYGLWRAPNGGLVTLTQNGGLVRGTIEGEPGSTLDGSGFDGSTVRIVLTAQINPTTRARAVGTLNFDGTRLTGRIDDDQGHGSTVFTLTRVWRE